MKVFSRRHRIEKQGREGEILESEKFRESESMDGGMAPIETTVSSDKFWLLTETRALPLPSPFDNKGNYVISLSQLVCWMATKAEELGVEIYPGFAASEVIYDANQKVVGVGTNDMGVAKDGSERETFQRGVELRGKITLLAEGCRGSLSEELIRDHKLHEKGQGQHQTYALGIKEVWEIEEAKHIPGSVLHTLGWPLDRKAHGGSFLYHMKDNQISIGLVVALNYHNPYLSPYDEFQACDVKDPKQNIKWTVPEGGGGPGHSIM